MKTTLNKIKQHRPCEASWITLLTYLDKTGADDEELSIKTILDACGTKDAIWALRAVEGYDKEIRLFACDCAESVLHFFEDVFPNDTRPRVVIETARRYANGQATKQELCAVRDAREAAWAAAWAASDAAWAASDVASDVELKKQKEFLLKYI
jgi:hypothetical protein